MDDGESSATPMHYPRTSHNALPSWTDLRTAYNHPIEKAQDNLLEDRERKNGKRIDEHLEAEDTLNLARKGKLP
jgi:hypothetical protein